MTRRPTSAVDSFIAARKKFNEAIADYDKSLEIKPDPDVYTKRGTTYVTYLQNYEKGIADYQQALRINPNDYDTSSGCSMRRRRLPPKMRRLPRLRRHPHPSRGCSLP
jgi:FOG: TPR repeat